jgi:predicted phosphodiesterase
MPERSGEKVLSEVLNKRKPNPFSFDQVIEVLELNQHMEESFQPGQMRAEIMLTPEYRGAPIMILFASDMHFGDRKTRHSLIKYHLDEVEKSPNTYIVFGADSIDNYQPSINSKAAMEQQSILPGIQSQVMVRRMKDFNDKRKAVAISTAGGHESFLSRQGYDWYCTYMSDFDFTPILMDRGIVCVHFGEQVYKICIVHDANSRKTDRRNPLSGAKALFGELPEDVDIILTGHSHLAVAEQSKIGCQPRLIIMGGSYKLSETYELSDNRGMPGFSIFLYPDRKLVSFCADFEVGKRILEAEIAQYKRRQLQKNIHPKLKGK